ncbi:MAG: hypothetical protein Kow0029_23880 [Candidatus Rifleibacteriota bacterium]
MNTGNQRTDELISFCNLLMIALKSGKPLPVSLLKLNAENNFSKSAEWCRTIAKRLEEGHSLEDSVRALSDFDPVLARIIPLMGERRLVKVLEIYTNYLAISESLNQKLKGAIFYPFAVMLLLSFNLFHLNFFLFPNAMKDLLSSGKEPSLLMQLLYFAEPELWPGSLFVPLLLVLVLMIMTSTLFSGKVNGLGILYNLSGFKQIYLKQCAARVQAALSLYLESGISLEKAIAYTADAFNEDSAMGLREVADALEKGNSPEEAFSRSIILKDIVFANQSEEDLPLVLRRWSGGNFKSSVAMLETVTNISGTLALVLAGFFVLCVTSGFFNTYYWLIRSY